MSKELTREQILAADDIVTEKVEVPEWKGHVYVRALTGTQRDVYQQSIITTNGRDTTLNMKNATSKLAALSMVNRETSKRLFSDADVKVLAAKSSAALQRVFDKASKLSGLSKEDMKEMTENLGDLLSEDSGSDSA